MHNNIIDTDPVVSVIVPVYNVEKYLRQCVESVLAQTFTHWELILVDDGSTDGSGTICDQYGAEDSRINVIHVENGGVSKARNIGIEHAKCEYLTFLDADDTLNPHFLEILAEIIKQSGCGIVCAELHNFEKEINPTYHLTREFKIYGSSEFIRGILYQNRGDCSPCGKLYAKRIFDKYRYKEDTRYEDLDLFYKLFSATDKVAFIPAGLYNYRQHPDSYTKQFTLRRADVLDVTDRMVEWIGEHQPDLLPAAEDRRMSAHFNIYGLLAANHIRNSELETRCWKVICAQRWKSLIDGEVRLQNKAGALLSYLGRRPLRIASRIFYR